MRPPAVQVWPSTQGGRVIMKLAVRPTGGTAPEAPCRAPCNAPASGGGACRRLSPPKERQRRSRKHNSFLSRIEGVTGKTAFSPVRPHIFASVECLALYFNRTHNTQNLLLKKQRTRDICTANTLTTHHQRHTAIARGARFLHGESACRHVWHIYWPPLMNPHHCGIFS